MSNTVMDSGVDNSYIKILLEAIRTPLSLNHSQSLIIFYYTTIIKA